MRRPTQQMLPLPTITHERRYAIFDEPLLLETNDSAFIEAADVSLGRFDQVDQGHPLRIRLIAVDEPRAGTAGGDQPWRVDYRTDGRVYTVATPDTVAVADLRGGAATAFVGPRMLGEPRAIRRELVEGLSLAMATGGRGYCPIHAAGIARDGFGIALVGHAGAGKSTLTLAAARRGLSVFAEDAIYARAGSDGLQFWGLPWIQRMLPDALTLFPDLDGVMPTLQANGETKLEVDLDERHPGLATPRARPAALVLLSRRPGATRLYRAEEDDASSIEINWAWGDAWTGEHQSAAEAIAQLPLYRLEMGGSPDEALDALEPILGETAGLRLAS